MRSMLSVPYSADLTAITLEQVCDRCKLIYPTRVSAAQARKRFMADWKLQDCEFLAMNDLKSALLLPSAPAVSDDKRMLCLYQALTEEDKRHFHINGYFDIVEWGNHFFQFFEEMCDECVDASLLEDVFGNFGISLLAWQEEYLLSVLGIYARYKDMLASLGFSDPIFSLLRSQIRVSYSGFRFVFVNQFYYSKLEKELLRALEASGNEIVIISQTTEKAIDPELLQIPEIRLNDLTTEDIRTDEVRVFECENEEQMVLAFLENFAPAIKPPEGSAVIVDSHFSQKHYRYLFDPAQFNAGQSGSMTDSGIYSFLQTLLKHLSALNANLDKSFIPLRMILAACSQESFLRYYQPDWSRKEFDALLDELRFLFDQDILYVDKDLGLLKLFAGRKEFNLLPQVLVPHFALLERLSTIQSPADLIALIDAEEGLEIQKMCSEQELQYSDVLEKFYERLANFATLESSGFVASWRGIFGAEGLELSASVLQLWLESLASAGIHFRKVSTAGSSSFGISNMLDLRNLTYDTVAVFHAIEGEYPSNPAPTWLFNENQRSRLGLKSYPQLRERERYYFFRQIFSARKALIYTYRNQEKDIEPGSFVSELLHAEQTGQLPELSVKAETLAPVVSELYRSRLEKYAPAGEGTAGQKELETWDQDKNGADVFFVLPGNPAEDFGPEHKLKVSYQSLSQLDKNPFVWYVNDHRKLRRTNLRPEETITRKLFGALLHGFLSGVLGSLEGSHLGTGKLAEKLDSASSLQTKLDQLLLQSIYLYKLPQNYNHEFLKSVISSCLVRSVQEFYHKFLYPKLRDRRFELIPEKDHMTELEREHKLLVSHLLEETEYQLKIRGIADLRIECDDQNLIVDFKTGGHEDNQLVFYEWFYYLLDAESEGKELKSSFWMILDQEPKGKTDQKKRDKWKERMEQDLIACLAGGFTQGRSVQSRKDLRNITRADLYHPTAGGEE